MTVLFLWITITYWFALGTWESFLSQYATGNGYKLLKSKGEKETEKEEEEK